MRKVSIVTFTLLALFLGAMMVIAAEEEAESSFEYVGPKKCKMCHKDVYAAWEETPHATTFDSSLSAEEQKNDACITCHITGHDEDGELIANVTCEACHGAGSEYKSPKIMSKKWEKEPDKYKAMAVEAGLVYPTEENCKNCHKKEGNPNFKPFNFEEMQPKVHPVASE